MRKKSPYLRTSSFSNMAVRGGLTRFARPFGAAHSLRSRSVQLAFAATRPIPGPRPYGASACAVQNCSRQFCVEPRSGILIPPQACNMRKKSPYLRTSSFSNMAVRGGFEPPIRCRIHTFQACSFSHSDTSPYCLPSIAGTSANVGKRAVSVNKLFRKIVRLDKLQANCFLNIHKSSFLRSPLHFSGRVSEICYSVKPQK